MRKTKFFLEPLNNMAFEGFTLDEDWNGWACPYFTYEEALRVVETQKGLGGKAWYERDSDKFVFEIQKEREVFSSIEVEGRKLYPIGMGLWIWEEVEIN